MREWAHAPVHRLAERGTYMVTGSTLHRVHHLNTRSRLSMLNELLFDLAEEWGWQLQAWAIMPNHYHFLALSPEDPSCLQNLVAKLHAVSGRTINDEDCTPGRQVWYQYWDSKITYQKSYLARLNYIHQNPRKHGLVQVATEYRWCSAWWFRSNASPAFQRTVESFKMDRLNVVDEYGDLELPEE